eukprot:2928765-Rhodomonas_salina.1
MDVTGSTAQRAWACLRLERGEEEGRRDEKARKGQRGCCDCERETQEAESFVQRPSKPHAVQDHV